MDKDDKKDDAIGYLRRGLEIFPDSPRLNMKLGLLLVDLLVDSKNAAKLKIDDTNAPVVCLNMAAKIQPERPGVKF